jgi:Flp pilus assembly protein TadG
MIRWTAPHKVARRLLERVQGHARCARQDIRGASAVEFALIAPVLFLIFFGTVELSQGVAIDRKVTITARTLSDLISQSTSITNNDMANIFAAASSIMTPYSSSPLAAKVAAVSINGSGVAKVTWSDGSNDTPRSVGSTVTVPTALAVPNTQLILSEVTYTFMPTVGYVVKAAIPLSSYSYTRPRQSSSICRPPTVTTCS